MVETALEYASKSKGRHSYKDLKKELGLRFGLREPPIAARQNLYLMKQSDDESLEAYLQRVLTAAMHGLKTSDHNTVQLLATETFLRGCKHKEAAALISNEAPQTIQETCKKIKTVIANRKAIFGSKVSFQEKAFTVQEENRVSEVERKLDTLADFVRRSSPSPYRDSRDRPRYSSPLYRDSLDSRQFSPRQQSPSYDRGWPPRNSGRGRSGDGEYRGRSPTRTYRDGPQQGPYNRSPTPQRREQCQQYRPQSYGGQYTAPYGGQYTAPQQNYPGRDRSPQQYRPQNPGGQYSRVPQQGQPLYRPSNQGYPCVGASPDRSFNNKNLSQSEDQYKQKSVDSADQTAGQFLSPEQTARPDLNMEGLVVPATNH